MAKIKCLKCGDIIESVHRHDFKWCSCQSVAVDGGKDYTRIVGDLSSYIIIDEKKEEN